MTNVALFYEQAVPLTRTRHGRWSLETDGDYAFARNAPCVPLMTVEFIRAAREFPIVFLEQDDSVMPIVLLGLTERQNLHVSDSGAWIGDYIPAFVRRYPFIFVTGDGGESFTLCIDERYAGFDQEGAVGKRLFDDEGHNTGYLEEVLAFLKDYEVQYRITREFARRVMELEVLEPMQASIALEGGERKALKGFLTVKRERLKALEPEILSGLARTNVLELIFLHVFSLESFSRLADRLAVKTRARMDG